MLLFILMSHDLWGQEGQLTSGQSSVVSFISRISLLELSHSELLIFILISVISALFQGIPE